jgi:MurNAc alpha-1-phosphate uridylyltransferase
MNPYPVVILAGGEAMRLRPLTEKIPKALVNVGGEPFINHQLRLLRFNHFSHVVISAWYLGEKIRGHVGNGAQFGVNVEYVFDGDQPLGTGGAIRHALPLLRGPFFVMYGDSYLPCDYHPIQEYFSASQQLGLMTVYRNRGKWDTSNVEMAKGRIVSYDKEKHTARMEYIDYGLSIFQPEAFESFIDGQPADLTDVYQGLIPTCNLLAYEVEQRFYEIGSVKGLRELDTLLTQDPNRFLDRRRK